MITKQTTQDELDAFIVEYAHEYFKHQPTLLMWASKAQKAIDKIVKRYSLDRIPHTFHLEGICEDRSKAFSKAFNGIFATPYVSAVQYYALQHSKVSELYKGLFLDFVNQLYLYTVEDYNYVYQYFISITENMTNDELYNTVVKENYDLDHSFDRFVYGFHIIALEERLRKANFLAANEVYLNHE